MDNLKFLAILTGANIGLTLAMLVFFIKQHIRINYLEEQLNETRD